MKYSFSVTNEAGTRLIVPFNQSFLCSTEHFPTSTVVQTTQPHFKAKKPKSTGKTQGCLGKSLTFKVLAWAFTSSRWW